MTQKNVDWLTVGITLTKVLSGLSLVVNGLIILAHLAVGTWSKVALYTLPFGITLLMVWWLRRLEVKMRSNEIELAILRDMQRQKE